MDVDFEPLEPEPVRVLAGRVDSLYLSYALDVSPRAHRELEQAKAAAARQRRAPIDPRTGEPLETVDVAPVEFGGQVFLVKPYGAAAAPYIVQNDDLQCAVNPDGGLAPELQVKVLAKALWRESPLQLVAKADALARDLSRGGGGWSKRYVKRIDICADFQGWLPKLHHLEMFCRPGAPTVESFEDDETPFIEDSLETPRAWFRWNLTGFRFGKTSTVTRLYDKTQEIIASGKPWMRAVWAHSPWYAPELPVWRLEVQCPRDWLKDQRNEGSEPLETVEDVLAHVGPIWRTMLTKRIRLTNGDDERLTRATVHPVWRTLTKTLELDGCLDDGLLTKLEQDTISAEALVPKIRGYLAKRAALLGSFDLDDAFLETYEAVRALCEERGESFQDLVAEKALARRKAEEKRERADFQAQLTRRKRERDALQVA